MKHTTLCILLLAVFGIASSELLRVELREKPLNSMKGFDAVLRSYHSDLRAASASEDSTTIETLKKRIEANPFFKIQHERILRQQTQFLHDIERLNRDSTTGIEWTVDYATDPSSGERVPTGANILSNAITVDIGASPIRPAIAAIRSLPSVRSVHLATPTESKLFEVVKQISADAAWSAMNVSDATAGRGVKIAFVDNGAYASHPMMADDNIEYLNMSHVELPSDPNNTNKKVAVSRAYGVRYSYPTIYGNQHGIAVSTIAAGRAVDVELDNSTYKISGIAPGAWVFNYLGNNDLALDAILLDNPDIATAAWGHSISAFYNSNYYWYVDFVQVSRSGIFLVKAAGDEGPDSLTSDHVGGAAGGIVVGAATKGTKTISYLEVEGEKFTFTRTVPSGAVGHEYTLQRLDDDEFLSCDLSDIHTFTKDDAVLVLPASNCTIRQLLKSIGEQDIGMLIFAPNSDYDKNPGSYDIPVVVISHVDGSRLADIDRSSPNATVTVKSETVAPEHPDAVAEFSSRGPSVDMTLVPHVIAPGTNILAGGYGDVPDPRLGYSFQSGSSMATAVVSGAAAIIRQHNPKFTNAEIKSALMSTADYADIVREEDGKYATVLDMGAGRINLEKALAPHLRFDPPLVDFSLVQKNQGKKVHVNVTSYVSKATKVSVNLMTRNAAGELVKVAYPYITVTPETFTISSADANPIQLEFVFRNFVNVSYKDHSVFVVFRNVDADNAEIAHMPLWAKAVCGEDEKKDVFLITLDSHKCRNDSKLYPIEDLRKYYEDALTSAGLSFVTYEYCDTDGVITVPEEVTSLCFRAVIIATGTDYGYPLNPIEGTLRRLMHSGVPVIQMGANSVLNWGPIGELKYGSDWILDHEFGFVAPPNDGWHRENYVQVSRVDTYPLIETHVPRVDEDDYKYETNVLYRDARNHPLVFLYRDQPELNKNYATFDSTGLTSFIGIEELSNQKSDAPRFIKDLFYAATETSTSDISVAYKFKNTYDGYSELAVTISTKYAARKIKYVGICWHDKDEVTEYNDTFYSKTFTHRYNTTSTITPYVIVESTYMNHFVYNLGEHKVVLRHKSFFAKHIYYFLGAIIFVVVIIAFLIGTIIAKSVMSKRKTNAYENLREDLNKDLVYNEA